MSFGTAKPGVARTSSLSAALSQAPAVHEEAAAEERPKAKLWLNVGIEVPFINEDGEQDVEFISLPFGLALDQMKPSRVTNNESLTSQRNAAKNRLLENLIQYGLESINPGEDNLLDGLQVRLRHVSDEIHQSTVQNTFTDAVDSLFKSK